MAVFSPAGVLLLSVLGLAACALGRPNPLSWDGHWPTTSPVHSEHHVKDTDTSATYHQHVQRASRRYSRVLGSSVEKRFNQAVIENAVSHLQETQANASAPVNLLILDESNNPNPEGSGFSPIGLEIALVQPVIRAEQPRQPNSIGLDIQANDIGYIATVQIGTPPKNFSLFVDSGSSDLWVGHEECKGYDVGDCGAHTFLGNSSTTFNNTGDPWHIRYGAGFVLGKIVTDLVSIAGLQLKAPHKFGVAMEESPEFASSKVPYDGFLGTAKSHLSQQHAPTLIEALRNEGLVKEGIVSYHIPRALDTMKAGVPVKNVGELTLGAMNPAKFNASTLVTVRNVSPTGFWEAPVDEVRVNGTSIGLARRSAILDTGSTLLVAPKVDVSAIHMLIPGSLYTGTRWIIPCTTNATISLVISGQEFPIDSRDLLFLPLNMGRLKGYCWSSISEMQGVSKPKGTNIGKTGGKTTSWLVGDVFLKNVYFSTNLDRDTISIARLAEQPDLAASEATELEDKAAN
ncbi:acid protease [Pleurotus eryngii]|uniref:Acid protease n=1 Tax=Pleurotus eryngii TaxID=5323 RepID=A0A9P5ZRU8_PLEER|nr:acid protease [Pleurotus eryngii]